MFNHKFQTAASACSGNLQLDYSTMRLSWASRQLPFERMAIPVLLFLLMARLFAIVFFYSFLF